LRSIPFIQDKSISASFIGERLFSTLIFVERDPCLLVIEHILETPAKLFQQLTWTKENHEELKFQNKIESWSDLLTEICFAMWTETNFFCVPNLAYCPAAREEGCSVIGQRIITICTGWAWRHHHLYWTNVMSSLSIQALDFP